MSITMKGIDRQ